MASRMLGNLLVRFRWGLFVIDNWLINPVVKMQIIYPYQNMINFIYLSRKI
ncbi:hypothetical protein [Candidatus Phytoplasma bonamiae]|uniref:Uncharacterized protein n=1 Tax=Candidatus Phytoplasma bonamiae TaxID=2982626 RepID=A0ABT9D842_9MOLU|nr:hypothetical protein ['Bonamia sp.' little leaf phytoplasma]MDO8064201.1 hypothetical protein ['Bonamia sp.' little leaf phytoplasma]MDV3174731.1 hypothetical protein ['Bonamia sp.' little leaf phytoplasma]